MTAHRSTVFCLILGAAAFLWPAAVWAFIVESHLRNPEGFHDQGGMAVFLFLFPLAVAGSAVCGGGAVALARAGGGPRWTRIAGVQLAVFGMLLAVGTCVGPLTLADAIR